MFSLNIYTYVIFFSTGSEHSVEESGDGEGGGWTFPAQEEKNQERTQDCRALCQNRTLVEEIFVKKTMCTQYNQYFIISHNIFNDAGHFCEIPDNFVKRNVQRVRN